MRVSTIPLFYTLLILLSSFSYAQSSDLPNRCSRDQNPNELTILSYHEIADHGETLDSTYTLHPKAFEEQMVWFRDNGYHFIDVDDFLEHRKSKKRLPDKAVLITFDDGYKSVYTNAFPVLKKYQIPAVIALVGSWMKADSSVDFSGQIINRDKFLSQDDIRQMVRSGLIEIASHSYDSHKGLIGNPQGNTQPAFTTRQWFPKKRRYETQHEYEKRIYDDLLKSSRFIEHYTHQKPRVIVWPYGRYNIDARRMAHKAGMGIGLTLDDGSNTAITPLWGLRRILVSGDMTIKDLELEMKMRNLNITDDGRTTKAAHIDLDYMFDPDPAQQERNLGALIERLRTLGINTVYLQAFADPDGNGAADYVYFPNRHVPMRADIFDHVAWQIRTRTQVKRLYAWMPMMAWELPRSNQAYNDKVITLQGDSDHLNMGYLRLSPFSPRVRKVIREVYEDLGKSAYFDGVLFHDDVTLSDFEDDSSFARQQYQQWGLPSSVMKIRKNHQNLEKWTVLKTDYLDTFAKELSTLLRGYQPGLKSARNMYAQVAQRYYGDEWYAQDFASSLRNYDYTAIMAMPYMEKAPNSREFYDQIINRIKEEECGVERTVMELQSVDWRKNDEPISANEMSDTIQYLYDAGIHHVAYYPDNVFKNVPDADAIRKVFDNKAIRMDTILKPVH